MSSIETVKSYNTPKIKSITEQIKTLQQLQQSGDMTIEALAQKIEPLAQALLTMTEAARAETRRMEKTHRQQLNAVYKTTEQSMTDLRESHNDLTDSIGSLRTAANRITDGVDRMKAARKMISLKIIALALALGLMIGTAAGAGSWHLLRHHYITSSVMTAWPNSPETVRTVMEAFK